MTCGDDDALYGLVSLHSTYCDTTGIIPTAFVNVTVHRWGRVFKFVILRFANKLSSREWILSELASFYRGRANNLLLGVVAILMLISAALSGGDWRGALSGSPNVALGHFPFVVYWGGTAAAYLLITPDRVQTWQSWL